MNRVKAMLRDPTPTYRLNRIIFGRNYFFYKVCLPLKKVGRQACRRWCTACPFTGECILTEGFFRRGTRESLHWHPTEARSYRIFQTQQLAATGTPHPGRNSREWQKWGDREKWGPNRRHEDKETEEGLGREEAHMKILSRSPQTWMTYSSSEQ